MKKPSITLKAFDNEIGMRLDKFLSFRLNLSRNQVEKLIKNQQILLNNEVLDKKGILIKNGDILDIKEQISPQKTLEIDFCIPILYEDEEVLVINKPINLLTHRVNDLDKEPTLVDYLIEKNFSLSNLGDSHRLGIIHRLDKGTSGAMIIAKNNTAHENLSLQIQSKTMGRYYLCVIDKPLKEHKIIELPLIRSPKNRLKQITTTSDNPLAKSAKSAFFKIIANPKTELIGAKLFSGRTHQIRAHLAAINRHILGDNFYGYKDHYQKRILLHSHLLYFIHPKTQKLIKIYAPLYEDMKEYLEKSYYQQPLNKDFYIPLDEMYCHFFGK
ncbi:RluA family pseudouridine synthase [Helicobacter mesocricetorum]|uniref:RluA family pseudouridine synthase n=1 Tax=Helicobacter mesocricetorum TaxID=87012 RepID=UPI001F31C77F|nr:RluA family pseudouridine synthase [Helicobacter mesocricetorum]